MSKKKYLIALLFVIPLYVLFYFMSKNSSEYEITEYVNTLIYVFASGCLSVLVCYLVSLFSTKTAVVLGGGCFCLLLSVVLDISLLDGKWLYSVPVSVFCFGCVLFLWRKNLLKPVLGILILMSLFSIGCYVYEVREDYTEQYAKLKSLGKMEKKPNIYLIVLEAYTGPECLEKKYGYDNKEFYQFLEKNAFKTYRNVYATRSSTRGSLLTLMTMSNPKKWNERIIKGVLKLYISSPVLDTLRKNGYSVNFKFPNGYVGPKETLEEKEERLSLYNSLFKSYFDVRKPVYPTLADFTKVVERDIENLSLDAPVFFMTKIGGVEGRGIYTDGLNHPPASYWRKVDEKELSIFRKIYLKEMQKENLLIQSVLTKIIEKDENAVIILMGDHGPLLYNTWKKVADYQHYGVSKEDFILDQFNIHLSIRVPEDIKLNISDEKYYVFDIFQDILGAVIPNFKKKDIVPHLYNLNGEIMN